MLVAAGRWGEAEAQDSLPCAVLRPEPDLNSSQMA
eukprot:CAMPEP_0197882642 /NCGR_PEP_ID=MMETSP1439-20131203/9722_1 /TAXON_ID=66791 /ORGANISM="Gonyaulax spinifera, Strain CCMP409" /LENGTH=34 /DNA_ID= /DNA_START= /DNA_END= /DNA_ORIENTATION=